VTQESKARSISTARFWKQHRLLVITTSIVIFLAIVLSTLPLFLQRAMTNFLTEHGAQNVSIGDVDFNIFSGALTIREAGYELVEENPFRCREMAINIDIIPTFSNRIFVQDVKLDDCRIVVHRPDPDTLIVNGFKILPAAATAKPQHDATAPAPAEPWFVGLHRVHLSKIAIHYKDTKITTDITIDNITLNDLTQWNPDLASDYSIAIKVNNAPISLAGTMQPFHTSRSFTGNLQISDLDFKPFVPLFEESGFIPAEGLLNTELKLSSALNDENKYEVSAEGNLDMRTFRATLADDQLAQDKLQWNGKIQLAIDKLDFYKSISIDNNIQLTDTQYNSARTPLAVKIASVTHKSQLTIEDQKDKAPKTHLVGSTTVSDFNIANTKAALTVASINSIEAKDFELSNTATFLLPSLTVRDAKFAGKSSGTEQKEKMQDDYLLRFANLKLSDTQVVEQRDITLASIIVKDVQSQFTKEKTGKLKYIDEISQTFAAPDAPKTGAPASDSKDEETSQNNSNHPQQTIKINAGVFELLGNNSVVYTDNSLEPVFQINLHNLLLKLTGLDTASPNSSTKITFSTDIDESGKFQLSGESQLFSHEHVTNLTGKLTNLEVHPFTSFTLSTTGRKIRHGLLSSDISVAIKERKLDSKFEMTMKNLSLSKDDSALAKKYDDTMPMPLEMAIDLMEDKQGRIELSVPVQGDLDNPAFQVMPAILTAMRKTLQLAALSYMKYALQPWGSMIFVGELLHGQMTKITFEPVEFAPGKIEILDAQKEYLDKLGGLMQKTPQLDLTICGIATAQDIDPSATKTDKGSQTEKTVSPSQEVNHDAQLSLARQRADAVKAYLIQEKQIAPERLHNCSPTFKDDINTKPFVDFVF
jgi:hypothetical protein